MVRDLTIGQYYPGHSLLHKTDPRVKIVLTLVFIFIIFFCQNFFSLGLMVAALFAGVALSRVPLKMLLKSMKAITFIILITALLNLAYTTSGNVLFSFKFFKITDEGVYTAVFVAVRILALIAGSALLTYTTTPTMLTDAIERLLKPLKLFHVPVHTLAMMMTLALRFIPTLIEEIDKIMNAQKARGADLESGGLMQRAKALVPILIPLFVSSFRRAYELAFAMECRCYTGGEGRTRMKQMKLKGLDSILIIGCALLLGGVIALNLLFKAYNLG